MPPTQAEQRESQSLREFAGQVMQEIGKLQSTVQSIEDGHKQFRETVNNTLDKLEKKLDQTNDLLTDQEKGLLPRVGKLEAEAKNRSWLLKTTLGAAILAMVSNIGSVVHFFIH